jgi:hypothetical protein
MPLLYRIVGHDKGIQYINFQDLLDPAIKGLVCEDMHLSSFVLGLFHTTNFSQATSIEIGRSLPA